MINLKEAELTRLVIHRVGSKNDDQGIVFSEKEVDLSDHILRGIFQKYFLSGFKDQNFYNLHHESNIELNEIFHFSTAILQNPGEIVKASSDLAKHLYECSDHPNIKPGDFCIAYIENCTVNEEYADAVGLFKIENKDTFLKIGNDLSVLSDEGININKLDKGCIVFNSEKDKGYFLAIEDHTNKGNEAQYWKEKFLNVKPREDNFYHTKNYIHLCKNFCKEVLDKEEKVEKADQIDFMNRSAKFFNQKENFNVSEFEAEVIAEPQIIDKFRGFKNEFGEKNDFNIFDEFNISEQAVKGSKKVFKSVLKLDKNFHIYVHGNRDLIEKGFDEDKGMNYYKVYFKEEKD